ncbi:MAG: ATP-dependent Zn protease [Spirulinaceae cyanobacterium]
MQTTALNLLAIGIFIMTLSVLLSPLLQISPFIPTGITFAVLGLITADTLGLQGKGMTLLLDGVSRFSGEYRDRVVRHEAGHFLVAYHLDIPIKGYTLNAWEALQQGQNGIGGAIVDTEALLPEKLPPGELKQLIDRLCAVWMAGIAAETLSYGEAKGGRDDREKLAATLDYFGRPESETPLKQRWGELQATTLLKEHQNAYEALVTAMQTQTSVSECYQILQQFSPGQAALLWGKK